MRAPLLVICGPMFAGKTTELQRRIALAQAAGERVLVVKPARDTRYGESEIVTHNGVRVPARSVATLDEIVGEIVGEFADARADARVDARVDLIAIDEIHFFASEAVAPIEALLARGTRVAVAGCD
ncbi:MAG: hypothetical protein WCI96_13825, partial [Planctomycetota bacterium]